MTEAFLRIEGLSHSFGDLEVLRDVSFVAGAGEIVALLGPSGSGKTTLLRAIAGFEVPQRGRIEVGGRDVTGLPPAKRGFGMVFQSYALFPHLNVGDNVRFGLEAQGEARGTTHERVAEMLGLVELPGFEDRRVGEISGGQQQRVALARALAPRPSLLMLDEPLSNLDPALRERTRQELRAALKAVGMTTVLVTHEQEEAFDLGDRVAVLHDGRLEQIGTPRDLYARPRTRFVATFVGRGSLVPGAWRGDGEGEGEAELQLGGRSLRWRSTAPRAVARDAGVEIVVRPESLRLSDESDPSAAPGSVQAVHYLGPLQLVRVDVGGTILEVQLDGAAPTPSGGVWVSPVAGGPLPHAFARSGGGS